MIKILILSCSLWIQFAIAGTVSRYKVSHFCYDNKAIIRTFDLDGIKQQWSVDTQTLQSTILPATKAAGHPCGDSRYTRLLRQSSRSPYPLQNDGITHGTSGIAITTDLCPSSKQGFERRLYRALIEHFPHPVPLTLFVTGKWIDKHPQAFQQLRRWEAEKKLAINWGNHTYSHPYHSNISLDKNFVLSKGYRLKQDTLRLESQLISRGITPSIFFRFPGLVSDQKSIQTINHLGLVPIGSNTWIAKGEQLKRGSIVLLHGNKNEPKGVTMFLKKLQEGKIPRIADLKTMIRR